MILFPQFSLRQLCLTVSLYALAFGLLTLIGPTPMEMALVLGVLTCFLIGERWLVLSRLEWPTYTGIGLYVAYYATAGAIAIIGCLFAFDPPPLPPAPTHLGLIAAIFWPIAWMIGHVLKYFIFASLLSTIGLIGSLFALRQSRLAWGLLLLNLPGAYFFCAFMVGLMTGEPAVDPENGN